MRRTGRIQRGAVGFGDVPGEFIGARSWATGQGAASVSNGTKIRPFWDEKGSAGVVGFARLGHAEQDPVFQRVWPFAFWPAAAEVGGQTAAVGFVAGAL